MACPTLDELKISDEKKRYIIDTVNPILEDMVVECIQKAPDDIVPYMLHYLEKKKVYEDEKDLSLADKQSLREENEKLQDELDKAKSTMRGTVCLVQSVVQEDKQGNEEEEDDEDEEPPEEFFKQAPKGGARASVSAEAYGEWNTKKSFVTPVYTKSAEQRDRLKEVLMTSFLFSHLDNADMDVIINAMQEVHVSPQQRVVVQGDEGDVLFVIESGSFECLVKDADGAEKVIKTCNRGDTFGELALLYNCPRAATVVSQGSGICWQLDRQTFNQIVKEAAQKKRNRYATFLAKVPLLASMDAYECSNLADAMESEQFAAGATIVAQDEDGDKFYIVEAGQCVAKKNGNAVMNYGVGDYFGELSLIRNQPRAATITAKGAVKLLSLDAASFRRLLNVNDLLERSKSAYQ